MRFKNMGPHKVVIRSLKLELEPGEECEVHSGYAKPTRSNGGSRTKSIIENLAPTLAPADPEERKQWLKIPGKEKAVSKVVKTTDINSALSPGVAEIVAAKKAKQETKEIKE